MNRDEKIHKLGNAIREYRGLFNSTTKKWIRPPKPSARRRIEIWLDKLMLPTAASMKAIDGFRTFEEMRDWMKAIPSNNKHETEAASGRR